MRKEEEIEKTRKRILDAPCETSDADKIAEAIIELCRTVEDGIEDIASAIRELIIAIDQHG